jgi:hypothetical protein
MKMEWIQLKENELPDNEVLCANFRKGTYGFKKKLIGYVSKYITGEINCSDENTVLENVTHYIDIHKFDESVLG